MIEKIAFELGPWSWMVLGFLLLGAEILAPGYFMLWIGIAAIVTGVLALAFTGASFATWQLGMVIFAVLSIVFAYVGKRVTDRHGSESDQPKLNQRGEQLVGRTVTLVDPIENGVGRARIGDSVWRVRGADAAGGATVRITGVDGSELLVEAL